jgi:hypothetical protein
LNRFRFPAIRSESLAPWVSAGLAVEAASDDDSGIVFQAHWGTKEFNAFLRNLFPQLFKYLGTFVNPHALEVEQEPDNVGKKRIDYFWPYVLLKKDRKRYEPIDNTHPTATTFHDNLSGDTKHSSFRGKGIFLGMSCSEPCLGKILKSCSHQRSHSATDSGSVVPTICCTDHSILLACGQAGPRLVLDFLQLYKGAR